MVVLLGLEQPVTGGKVVGAVALFKVPPQATELVHLFAFAFVLSKDLASHGTEPVGIVLHFGRSSALPKGPERQGARCPARGCWQSM